jgi:poly(3-hydroxyalkanoate) synthetase
MRWGPANFTTNPEALTLVRNTNGRPVAGLRTFADVARPDLDDHTMPSRRDLASTRRGGVKRIIQLIQLPSTDAADERPRVIIRPASTGSTSDAGGDLSYAAPSPRGIRSSSSRSATREIEHLTWDDYLKLGVLRPSGSCITDAKVHALGFCIGGTLVRGRRREKQ